MVKIKSGVVILLLLLVTVLLPTGCAGHQDSIAVEEVTSVTAEGVTLVPAEDEELISSLLESFNSAKYSRTGHSGPATHRLVLTTKDNAIYSFFRISDEVVEVGLRHGDLRKKFFLKSPELAELVQKIQDGE